MNRIKMNYIKNKPYKKWTYKNERIKNKIIKNESIKMHLKRVKLKKVTTFILSQIFDQKSGFFNFTLIGCIFDWAMSILLESASKYESFDTKHDLFLSKKIWGPIKHS